MPRGVRLNPEHDEKTRAKIQTSQIINRLIKLINGEITMSSQQLRAAEILLKKTLPDLTATNVTYESPKDLSHDDFDSKTTKEAARAYQELLKSYS